MEELESQFQEDRVKLLKTDVDSIESALIKSTVIGQFSLPEGLYLEKSDQVEEKKTSLAKLLGLNSKKTNLISAGPSQSQQFVTEKYERISSFAMNYFNNGLDFCLEKILLESVLFNKEKNQKAKKIEDALKMATHLKFRTNMKGNVMEENMKEEMRIKKPAEVQKEHLQKTMLGLKLGEYNSYMKQVGLLVKMFTFLEKLKLPGTGQDTRSLPFWVLKHIKSAELSLVYQTFNASSKTAISEGHFDHSKSKKELIKNLSLAFLEIEKVNEFYKENQNYEGSSEPLLHSNIVNYMKDRDLYSILYSRTANNNALRNSDLRLRVLFYEMQRIEISKLAYFDGLRSYLDSFHLTEHHEAFDIIVAKTENLKSEMLLSIYDLVFRFQWTYETCSSRDKSTLASLLELLDIFRFGKRPASSQTSSASQNTVFEPFKSVLRSRNLDLHSKMRSNFIEEIDALRFIAQPNFTNQEVQAYAQGFEFLASKSTFSNLDSWIASTDTFTKLLLHSKFSTANEVWQVFEGRQLQSIFSTTNINTKI